MVLNTVSKDPPCWLERIIYFLLHIIKNQNIGANYGYLLLSSYCLLCWSTLNVLFYLILSSTEESNSVRFYFKEEENWDSVICTWSLGSSGFWWHHTERFIDCLLPKLREWGGHWEKAWKSVFSAPEELPHGLGAKEQSQQCNNVFSGVFWDHSG